jgi:hypothetical protein
MRRVGLLLALLVVGCSSSDATPPPGEIALPESRCRAIGIAGCENGGRCVEEQGVAKCACAGGWSGATCNECAPGQSCASPSCAATKCSVHAVCSEAGGPPTCSCVTGYAIENQVCVWKGVLRDPSFQNLPPGAWTVTNATLSPTAPGAKDPGILELAGPACNPATTKVSQTVAMPPWEQSDALVLETTGESRCVVQVDVDVFVDVPCDPVRMSIDNRSRLLPGFSLTSTTTRRCLGEKAFGKTLALGFSPSHCDAMTSTIAIDRADILPSTECPLPGQIVNANFEGVGGWTPEGGVGAEVVPGVGNQSSRGGRLKKATTCDAPALRGVFSVRQGIAKPALSFTARGGAGRRMRVLAGSAQIGNVIGTGVFQSATLCLPDFMKGDAESLVFSGSQDRRPVTCGPADDYEFVFDELELKSDPTCPDAAPIVDGGFERDDTDRYWWADAEPGQVNFVKGAGAKTGNGFATITHFVCQRFSTISSAITIPEPMPGAGGAAIEFAYKAPAASNQTYIGPLGVLPAAPDWTVVKRCLPRDPGGAFVAAFSLSSQSSCQGTTLSIDDVRAVYDPACPE